MLAECAITGSVAFKCGFSLLKGNEESFICFSLARRTPSLEAQHRTEPFFVKSFFFLFSVSLAPPPSQFPDFRTATLPGKKIPSASERFVLQNTTIVAGKLWKVCGLANTPRTGRFKKTPKLPPMNLDIYKEF